MTGEYIIKLLRQVDPSTLWGLAIHNVVESPNSNKVFDLVINLRDQARDNEDVMKAILGTECFTAIMAI